MPVTNNGQFCVLVKFRIHPDIGKQRGVKCVGVFILQMQLQIGFINDLSSVSEALQGKSIFDIVDLPRFLENLAAYWTAQKSDRDAIRKSYAAMRKLGGEKGYKIPAHPIDDLAQLSVEDLAVEYAKVVAGGSTRNHAERLYIRQIGQQAYNLTVAQYVVDEYPELEPELLPNKTKAN